MTTTPPLRITRRGKRVLGLAMALPVIGLSVFLVSPGALADSEQSANDFEYMTVLSGTLCGVLPPKSPPRKIPEMLSRK